MNSKASTRFPFPLFPEGWFFISFSNELKIGEVKPIYAMGQHLVLFRNRDNQAVVFQAYCPHQGAHLGHGGTLYNNNITCPFHGWAFNSEGRCVLKPHNKNFNPKRDTLVPLPVTEVDNKIFIYHALNEKTPGFDIPALPEYSGVQWHHARQKSWKFKSHPQELAENLVDAIHFKTMHKTAYPRTTFTADGKIARVFSQLKLYTHKGEAKPAELTSVGYGLGYWVLKYSGIVDTLVIATITPLDGEYVNFSFEFLVDGDIELGQRFIDSIASELETDIIVWENKIYKDHPLLDEEDGPIMEYRQWCQQFY